MTKNTIELSIYVACLSSYNNGVLYGKHIDANQSAEDIQAEIDEMLNKSPTIGAEEYAIHGCEGFGGISLNESEDLSTIVEMASLIEQYGELASEVISYFANDMGYVEQLFEEYYCGVYSSEEEFVREMTEDCFDIPKHLQFYIDYELMARDWFFDSYLSFELGFQQVHVFHRY